ncbi:MAG: phospho-N-acetylmuramoyl-pentapeptide-transferase [Clostridia bacterium]|nr:phospho-N-acetylmuramoyl-pentapeptide-transferase [Clostridia bacterium]
MNYKIMFMAALLITFIMTVLISKKLIPALKSRKMGQKILDIGPRWHKSKEGTPTMGGLAFIIAMMVVGAACAVYLWITDGADTALPFVFTLALGLAGGLIGCIDDYAKLRNQRNDGLTPAQKFLLQLAAAALYLLGMALVCKTGTDLYIPYVGISLSLGVFYYVISLVLICGVMNSVNLTDGIDGLASSVTLAVGVFFTVCGFVNGAVEADGALVSLGAVIIGGCAGFLVYNLNPARVFMGDTGSLFLGGLVVGGAFMMGNPLIVVVCGLVYIIETASVMLQVSYFKLTHGKRLFKMSPIHHHFEKCGWSENKVVIVFTAVTVIFSAIAYFGVVR